MPLIQKQNRDQIQMLSLDMFIEKDNVVRVIDLFVDVTDMEGLGFQIKGQSEEGRPAYEAQSLLKLFIYGYLNRIRSGRQLAKACTTNIELWWLLQGLRPKYRTINEFRKNNVEALKKLFRAFNAFLLGQDVFSDEVVAIDGSKFGAQNSKKNNYNEKKIDQHLHHVEKEINEYLEQMQVVDELDIGTDEQINDIAEKLNHLSSRKEKYSQLKNELKAQRESGESQVSTTDPDARALPKKMNIVEVAYNVQTAVEAKNKFIIAMEVTNKNDTYALSNMAIKAKKALDVDKLKVLADKGYDTGLELHHCIKNDIETYVAPKKRVNKNAKRFTKDQFTYDTDKDEYICPAGQVLRTNGTWYKKGDKQHRKPYRVQHYKITFKKCNMCSRRDECIGANSIKHRHGKYIERSEYQGAIDENIERVHLNKTLYRQRQSIVEHPYGTIKRGWGYTYTLLKTKRKVSGEFALIFTCYNLRRSLSIFGVNELMERLKAACRHFLSQFRGISSLFKPLFWNVRRSPVFLLENK